MFTRFSKEDKELRKALKNILGYKPKYLPFYISAITHRSYTDAAVDNNERLEFLGDAYIGSIVGEYLFKKYPTKDEGYLTEMRSKIVSRQSYGWACKKWCVLIEMIVYYVVAKFLEMHWKL
jgi:ribonuclease-3